MLMTRTQQLSSFSVPVARGAGLSLPRASRPVGGVPSRHTPTISAMFRSTVRPTVSSLVSSVCSRHLTLPSRGIASQSKKSRGSLSKQHSFLRLTADGRKEAHQQSLKSLQSELDLKARDIFSLAAQASSEASVSSKTNAFQQLWRSSSLLQLRSNCLLASFGNVRMILCHDTALFFNPNSAAVRSLTRSLPNFSQSEEPFCLQLLEHLLRESCDSFDRRLVLCHTITNSLVADMDSERVDSHDLVHRLVPLQDLLYNFELELREAQQSLLDLLNRDDDIRKLVLLGQRTFRPQIKSSEVSSEQLSTQQRMSSGVSKDIAEEPSIATADSANEAEHQLFADVFPSISMDRQPRKVQNPPLNSVHKDADLSSGNFSSNATSPAADNEAVTEVELLLESYALRLSQSLSLISFLQQQAKSRQDLTELRLQLRRNRYRACCVTLSSY